VDCTAVTLAAAVARTVVPGKRLDVFPADSDCRPLLTARKRRRTITTINAECAEFAEKFGARCSAISAVPALNVVNATVDRKWP
jgi:hypothetical protein